MVKPDFIALYWPDDPNSVALLKKIMEYARKDKRSRSWVIREAVREYVENHASGNPQTDLGVWSGNAEPPKSLKSDDKTRFREAEDIYWLVNNRGMTIEQATASVKRKLV